MQSAQKLTETFTEAIKRLISKRAIREGWAFDQIQLAEDYIETLSKDKEHAAQITPRTIGLKPEHAEIIRRTIKAKRHDQLKRSSS